MKTNKLLFGKGFIPGMFPFVVLAILFAVFFQTCQLQKDELVQNVPELKSESITNVLQLKSGSITNNQSVIFYGHEKFIRDSGKPVAVKKKIGSENLSRFEPNFVVHIVNGDGKTNLVSAAIVKIDGKIIFNAYDFSQQVTSLTKDITGLTENSELEVELRSAPGSYIDFWIEGTHKKELPVLTTTDLSAITSTTATSGGNITNDGGASVTARGVCWSTTQNPTTSDSKTSDASGTGIFTSTLTGLTGNTTYYVRAYATNSVGTAYGNDISFTTATVPTLTIQPTAQIVTAGKSATFTVVATGNPAPTYQWQKNSTNILGAIASSYTTPATVLEDNEALYSCVVYNTAGSITSNTATLTVIQNCDPNSPSTDLAVNRGMAFPNADESDYGWGGGSNKWEIVDGKRYYPGEWAHGLAFTGGTYGYGGACGWRQATINFGNMVTFNKVVVWHNTLEHVPNTYKIEYWNGSAWNEIFSTVNGKNYIKCPEWPYPPTENTFPAVTGSKVRFSLNNCDILHGWIYEFEVYNE